MALVISLWILGIYITFALSQDNFFIYTYDDGNQGSVYLPYPNGYCTLTGNYNSPRYYFFECGDTNSFYCDNNNDNTCQHNGQCLPISNTASYNSTAISPNTLYYGQCPNGLFAKNTNYAQIALYSSYKSQNDGCPSSLDFTTSGTVYIATNICVEQSDASYLMMTCDGFTAEINVYSDNLCSQMSHTLIQYSRTCDDYANNGMITMYRRLEGCYVDNVDQLQQTPIPTANPTLNPTNTPTLEATLETRNIRSTIPIEPENVNILYVVNIMDGLDNTEWLCIVFGALLLFYLFICFYIWCNERRKRANLAMNIQREWDKKERFENGFDINNEQKNIVLLNDDEHREALINEGFIV